MVIDDKFEDWVAIDATPQDFADQSFSAPMYDFRRDSHHGYHLHLLKLHNGKYVQTDYAISVNEDDVYAFLHKVGKINFKMGNPPSKKMIKELEMFVPNLIRGIEKSEWRNVRNGKIHLFTLDL